MLTQSFSLYIRVLFVCTACIFPIFSISCMWPMPKWVLSYSMFNALAAFNHCLASFDRTYGDMFVFDMKIVLNFTICCCCCVVLYCYFEMVSSRDRNFVKVNANTEEGEWEKKTRERDSMCTFMSIVFVWFVEKYIKGNSWAQTHHVLLNCRLLDAPTMSAHQWTTISSLAQTHAIPAEKDSYIHRMHQSDSVKG